MTWEKITLAKLAPGDLVLKAENGEIRSEPRTAPRPNQFVSREVARIERGRVQRVWFTDGTYLDGGAALRVHRRASAPLNSTGGFQGSEGYR